MDLVFAGDEGSVAFEIGADGRVARVRLEVGPLSGEIATVVGLHIRDVREQLAAALIHPELTGRTSISAIEHDFSLQVDLVKGKGTITGSVSTQFAMDGGLSFTLTTNQSYLSETLRQLETILATQ